MPGYPIRRRRPLVARPLLGPAVVRLPFVPTWHARSLETTSPGDCGSPFIDLGCPGFAGADCPGSSASLRQRAELVVQAYAEQDREAYPQQRDMLMEETACIDEVISKNAAARIHLVMALDASLADGELDARSAQAVAESDPTLGLTHLLPFLRHLQTKVRLGV